MNGILAQLISMLSFGTSDALWRKPINKLVIEEAIVYRTVFSILFFSVLLIFVDDKSIIESKNAFGINIWLYTIFICCLSYFGLYFFTKAFKNAKTGLVVIVTSSTFLFGQFTSFVILGESPTIGYIIPFGLFLIAILLSDIKSVINIRVSKGVIYGILAALFWGTTFPLLSIPSKQIGYVKTGLILECSVMLMSFLSFKFIHKKTLSLSRFKQYLPFFVLLGFLAGNGVLFNNFSYTKIPVHIAGSISSSTHLVTILISWLVFKEKLGLHQYLAALISAFSIYYISTIL